MNVFEECKSFGRGICESDEDRNKKHLDYCVRLSLTANSTNGFFIAAFQRQDDDFVE